MVFFFNIHLVVLCFEVLELKVRSEDKSVSGMEENVILVVLELRLLPEIVDNDLERKVEYVLVVLFPV